LEPYTTPDTVTVSGGNDTHQDAIAFGLLRTVVEFKHIHNLLGQSPRSPDEAPHKAMIRTEPLTFCFDYFSAHRVGRLFGAARSGGPSHQRQRTRIVKKSSSASVLGPRITYIASDALAQGRCKQTMLPKRPELFCRITASYIQNHAARHYQGSQLIGSQKDNPMINVRLLIVKARHPQFAQMDNMVCELGLFTNNLSDPVEIHRHAAEQAIELGNIGGQIEDLIGNARKQLAPRAIWLGLDGCRRCFGCLLDPQGRLP
jgi:hypothetical protein